MEVAAAVRKKQSCGRNDWKLRLAETAFSTRRPGGDFHERGA